MDLLGAYMLLLPWNAIARRKFVSSNARVNLNCSNLEKPVFIRACIVGLNFWLDGTESHGAWRNLPICYFQLDNYECLSCTDLEHEELFFPERLWVETLKGRCVNFNLLIKLLPYRDLLWISRPLTSLKILYFPWVVLNYFRSFLPFVASTRVDSVWLVFVFPVFHVIAKELSMLLIFDSLCCHKCLHTSEVQMPV